MKVLFIISFLTVCSSVAAVLAFPNQEDVFLSTECPVCEKCTQGSCAAQPGQPGAHDDIDWRDNILGPNGELPVFPGGKGFGVYTRPAKKASVFKVTNLNASGQGSLKSCIDGNGPRVCVFEVSGRIKHDIPLSIKNDHIHIAGQTAPFPGITIQSPKNSIRASNVVVEHVRFMSSDELLNSNINNTVGHHDRDALAIESEEGISNIVLNHVSLNFGIDGILDIWFNVDDVTIRNSLIAMSLKFSVHVDEGSSGWNNLEAHATNLLIGPEVGDVDITRSVLGYSNDRLPRSGARNLFYSENINYLTGRSIFAELYTRGRFYDNQAAQANIVGNVYVSERNSGQKVVNIAAHRNGTVNMYYRNNSLLLGFGNNPQAPSASSAIRDRDNAGRLNLLNNPLAIPHAQSIPSAPIAEDKVLDFVGARPAQRIPLEQEIVANIKARKGEIVNCYSETGNSRFEQVLRNGASYDATYYTPPSIEDRCELDDKGWTGWRDWLLSTNVVNRRSLDGRMPASGEQDTILPSGYSKLEAFLHACSRNVEMNNGDCHQDFIDASGRAWAQE